MGNWRRGSEGSLGRKRPKPWGRQMSQVRGLGAHCKSAAENYRRTLNSYTKTVSELMIGFKAVLERYPELRVEAAAAPSLHGAGRPEAQHAGEEMVASGGGRGHVRAASDRGEEEEDVDAGSRGRGRSAIASVCEALNSCYTDGEALRLILGARRSVYASVLVSQLRKIILSENTLELRLSRAIKLVSRASSGGAEAKSVEMRIARRAGRSGWRRERYLKIKRRERMAPAQAMDGPGRLFDPDGCQLRLPGMRPPLARLRMGEGDSPVPTLHRGRGAGQGRGVRRRASARRRNSLLGEASDGRMVPYLVTFEKRTSGLAAPVGEKQRRCTTRGDRVVALRPDLPRGVSPLTALGCPTPGNACARSEG
ncbi:hypothetical protein Q5P01_000976 [Channa striata]|uniref:Uncharacterized protein n=1 Tax=Channa striata TaxID=64152 RepID=A0AA88IGV1_CHASR|nr:hypothetical protein Q5P01_000976 [Channa striata]